MNKILPILVIGFLVLSGLGAVGVTNNLEVSNFNNDNTTISLETATFAFSQMVVEEHSNEYFEVNLKDTSTYLMKPGNPVLPKVVKTFELPFGALNTNVEVTMINLQEFEIEKEIRPSPPHLPLIATEEEIVINYQKNEKVYSSEELYPSDWYDVKITCGLNNDKKRVTNVAVSLYPVRYSPKLEKVIVAEGVDIDISYEPPKINQFSVQEDYDMVIIAPKSFKLALNKLIRHKNNMGIKTELKTVNSILSEYDGVDDPEKIKYFIKDEIEQHGITYVLLVGGLKNQIDSNPREHRNYGSIGWHVPVRYHNFYDNPEHPLSFADIYDPGVISDLYYADIYKEGGEFEDWDSNDDGIIGAWNFLPDLENVENDTLDMYPDVILGRLACRNILEVRTVTNKIIDYEKNTYGSNWFKKMVVISGDGFMDQEDLDFQWNTTDLPEGAYTIFAESRVDSSTPGAREEIHVTIDRSVPTSITFNHDDYLRIEEYPALPIAEIVSVTDGDIIGYNDTFKNISEGLAYGNSQNGWANIEFKDGILHIRGKTYDPSPYGNITNIRVWIENEAEEVVFEDERLSCEMYYEGEWVTGDKLLKGGGGALYYLPEEFDKEIIWASNGKLNGPEDIMNSLNPGCGFAFMSGHGSPTVWTDHFPGIPGNRRYGSIPGFFSIAFKPDFLPVFPTFPFTRLKNTNKLPIILVGGCHNSQFNVSAIPSMNDKHNEKNYWTHGTPAPECFSWMLVKTPKVGAIATIGNTGLGYGVPSKDCTIEGLDGGICIEFFKQYGMEYDATGSAILGDVYTSTLQSYHNTFDMDFLDHAKSLTQWVLLGDPSLMIGGYP